MPDLEYGRRKKSAKKYKKKINAAYCIKRRRRFKKMTKKDFKLYGSLILYALLPSVYLLIRMQIVAVSGVDINIMGQIEWFDLIDEVLVTALTVPLYFLLKPDKEKTAPDKNCAAFLASFAVYTVFIIIVMMKIGSIAKFMNAENAVQYLFMQALSMLAGFVGTFMVMIFTLNDDDKLVRRLLVSRLCLQVVADWIFISSFKDVGAAYAEIAVNAVIGLIAVLSAYSKGYLKFAMPGKTFLKDWCKIGAFAGIQIFLDNFIYAVMVCKMVNAVSESGNYWVANNFIWGWLLVPVTCLVEVIKKNDKIRLTMKNCWRYLIMIFAVWLITMPRWKSFISGPMASDGNVIMKIVLPLVPFYITYMISAVIDGWFVSHGRTIYNAINSLIVNVGYYGIIYLAFKRGMFAENMMFIIGMFGCGMLVHMAASILMYRLEIIRTQTMPADCQKKAV